MISSSDFSQDFDPKCKKHPVTAQYVKRTNDEEKHHFKMKYVQCSPFLTVKGNVDFNLFYEIEKMFIYLTVSAQVCVERGRLREISTNY